MTDTLKLPSDDSMVLLTKIQNVLNKTFLKFLFHTSRDEDEEGNIFIDNTGHLCIENRIALRLPYQVNQIINSKMID